MTGKSDTFLPGIIIVGLIAFPLADSLGMFILVAVMLGWVAFLYPILTIHVIENAGLKGAGHGHVHGDFRPGSALARWSWAWSWRGADTRSCSAA